MQPTNEQSVPVPAVPAFQTADQQAAEIRAIRGAAGQGRAALQRLDDRLSRAARSDRPYDQVAAVRDVQAATAQVQELRRRLGMGPLTEGEG